MVATNSKDMKQEDHLCTRATTKLGINLASPNKAKREKAMSLLCLWLTSQREIKEDELLKIWKGLFYCIKHVDQAASEVDLIERVACLMERLDADVSLLFFKAFLTGLRREWGITDENYMRRFYLLLRQYVSHMFVVLRENGWDVEVVKKFLDALFERTFLSQDRIAADEVNLHITDIFLHELKHCLPISINVIEVMLETFWMTLVKGHGKALKERITEKVFLALLDYGCRHLGSKEARCSGEKGDNLLGAAALSLLPTIKTKSMTLLRFTDESNVVWLKLILEKSVGLENLLAHPGSTIINASYDSKDVFNQPQSQCYVDTLISLTDSSEKAESSPLHVMTMMRTFGRRSKRNQKLAFLPHMVDGGNTVGRSFSMPAVESWSVMSSSAQTQDFIQGSDFSKVIPLDKNQMNTACATQQNDNNKDIIDIGGVSAQQDVAMSEEVIEDMIFASEDGITMEDPVISNLTRRFDSIADESTGFEGVLSPTNTGGRKRKSLPRDFSDAESPTSTKENMTLLQQGHNMASVDVVSAKKAKKVHFSLKHNIVWKPSTPLPPHDVRVPPSATPRGSALKKGVPPGPILDLCTTPVSPKREKGTPRKAPAAHLRSPKNAKSSAKGLKTTTKGRVSPR